MSQTVTAEDLERYTFSHRREIVFYLRQLINDGERVVVSFDGGNEAILTVLLDVDGENNRLVFDWGGSEAANRKLLQSDRNLFTCSPHGIGNHFRTGAVGETVFQQRRAFVTRLPREYTRLQRREFFRLTLPFTRRPLCRILRPDADIHELSVLDISIGGLALEVLEKAPEWAIGELLPKARIDLKAIGMPEIDLEVRDVVAVQHGKKSVWRVGCRFINPGHALEHQLQRFITDVQREERFRLGG